MRKLITICVLASIVLAGSSTAYAVTLDYDTTFDRTLVLDGETHDGSGFFTVDYHVDFTNISGVTLEDLKIIFLGGFFSDIDYGQSSLLKAETIADAALNTEFTESQIGATGFTLNPGGHNPGDTTTVDLTYDALPALRVLDGNDTTFYYDSASRLILSIGDVVPDQTFQLYLAVSGNQIREFGLPHVYDAIPEPATMCLLGLGGLLLRRRKST